MRREIAGAISAILLIGTAPADARGLGRFVGGLVARGAASAATHGVRKSYTPDVLTVDQLVQCLKKATALDQDSDNVETKRKDLQSLFGKVDSLSRRIESKRIALNRYSQAAVDDFNADVDLYNELVSNGRGQQSSFNHFVNAHNGNIDSYNAACARKYFADDMDAARKLAGI